MKLSDSSWKLEVDTRYFTSHTPNDYKTSKQPSARLKLSNSSRSARQYGLLLPTEHSRPLQSAPASQLPQSNYITVRLSPPACHCILICDSVILAGILLSYLPQHHRIISRRTPEGISAGFILLGATSSTCALGNILLLPGSRADVGCCRALSRFECLAGLLGIAQIGVQWSCFAFM